MFRRCVLVVSLLAASSAAMADQFYISGSVGVSMFDDAVDTTRASTSGVGELPDAISLSGRAFDSNETASGFALGWHARDWLSIELGYTDFGNTGQNQPAAIFGPVPIITPTLPPTGTPPNNGGPVSGFISPFSFAAALSVEEWSIAAKFRKSLVSNLSANWTVGLSRARFDADGHLTVVDVVTMDPLVFNTVNVPYASPGDETGFNFGMGFEWQFSERFSADIGYRRHDTRAIEIETFTLQLVVGL